MKRQNMSLKAEKHWLILLLLTDLFFIFLTWLIGSDTFGSIIIIILLFTAIIFSTGYWIDRIKQKKQIEILQLFLNSLDEETERRLLATVDESWHPAIWIASGQLRAIPNDKDKQLELQNIRSLSSMDARNQNTSVSCNIGFSQP